MILAWLCRYMIMKGSKYEESAKSAGSKKEYIGEVLSVPLIMMANTSSGAVCRRIMMLSENM